MGGMNKMIMNNALEVRGLNKNYGAFSLKDVSFEIPKGYIMGFIGPNGAGKTTTIKSILNMINYQSGTIKLFGTDGKSGAERSGGQIGVVMDSPFYVEDWSLTDVEKAVSPFYRVWDAGKYAELLILGAPVFISVSTGGSTSGIIMAMMLSLIIFNYPFAVGSKSNIDALYTALALDRNTVVMGRYLFTFAVNIYLGIAANIITFIVRTYMQKGFDIWTHFTLTGILILACGIVQAVQLPIFFRLGYEKARVAAYLPLIVIPLVYMLINNFIPQEKADMFFGWLSANQTAAAATAAVVWLALTAVSYRISLSFYKKRDF